MAAAVLLPIFWIKIAFVACLGSTIRRHRHNRLFSGDGFDAKLRFGRHQGSRQAKQGGVVGTAPHAAGDVDQDGHWTAHLVVVRTPGAAGERLWRLDSHGRSGFRNLVRKACNRLESRASRRSSQANDWKIDVNSPRNHTLDTGKPNEQEGI